MIRISKIAETSGVMTLEFFEVLRSIDARLSALEGRMDAASGLPGAEGGATVDAAVRAELTALKAALNG